MVNSNDEYFNSIVGINNEVEPAQTEGTEQEGQSGVIGGGFDPTRYVPGVAGDLLTGLLFAYETALQAGQGAVGIVDDIVKGFETGEYVSGIPQSLAGQNIILQVAKAKAEHKVDIYENYVADMVRKGASEKLIKEQDPTNTVKMEKLTDWFEKTLPPPAVDSETGEVLDYISLYGRGEIIKGTDALIGDIAGSFPSLLISRVPVIGPAILGASTYMGEFESELIKRAKDPNFNLEEDRDNLVQNALITGASDFVWETVGGSMLNKIPGMKLGKEKIVDIIKESPKQLMKKAGLGFLSEFTTEGATGVTTELADVLSFGDDVKPLKDYFRTFFKDGFIGGFLGASSSGVSGLSAQNKEVIHEYVSPQTYKQDQFKLSTEILTLEQDKQKAKGKDVEYFETKIQELRDKKKANKENLNNFFNSLTKEQKVEYASNIDKQNDAINIIGNKDYSKEAQEIANKDLAKYTEANNKFFKDTEVNYIADFENYAKRTISNAAKLRKARGVFGFDNKNLNLVELNTAEEIKEVNDRLPGFNESDGLFLGEDTSGKPTMYINKKVAAETGATNVLGHEYLHAITSMAFKESGIGNENLGKAAKAFTEYLKSTGNSQVVEDIEERLAENYGGLDADGNIIRDENGLVKTSRKEQQEEYFNLFSDLISQEQIKNVEEKSGGIKNAFRQLFVGLGFSKVDFQDGQQVFDYLVDYNANMERAGILGKFVSKRIAKTKMKGLEATAAEKAAMDQIKKESKSGYTKTERDNRLDTIGEKSTKAEWDAGGADQAISDMYMSGDLEAIVRNNLSSDLKNLPNYSEEDFISETIGELMPHIKNFNIDRKETQSGFGLSGWIRGQISNKIGNVLKKKKATTETFTVDTTDEKVKETVESTDDLQDLQEEDLSVAAQAKKKAKAERREEKGMEEGVEYSTFRRALKVKGKQGLSDNIVDGVKQAVVKTMATEKTTPDSDKFIANIKKSFLTELKKPIQDMMGKKEDFTNFLKTNREAIIAALPTSTLVQMERNVNPEDRVFTVEVKRNLNPTETDDAIANNLLPKDTNRTSGPTLYNKRMPSEGEFLRYFSPPLYVPSKKDPNKSVRSGLKGTRKDTLAEQMGIELAFDATMEVVQSPDVAERRSLVTNTDFLDSGIEELARSIGRGVDVKFSRSNPAEVGIKMDLALDNVNTDAYLDIRFSKSSRDAYIKRLVKNRPDLKGKEEQYVDSVFDWLETTDIKKRSKYEKMAMHYMANGYLILPEDGYKVIEAERLATIKKIDPFSVGNPNEIIEKYAGTVKGARTNPDTVKEFSNKKDLGEGVVTYDVEQTKEGQIAVRKVIDTHFGKKSNPWCLTARIEGDQFSSENYVDSIGVSSIEEANEVATEQEAEGYVTRIQADDADNISVMLMRKVEQGDYDLTGSYDLWERYQEGGKGYQIIFTDGKLSHFKDGSGKYWDRMDAASDYISKKLNDIKTEDGFTQERELNVNTGKEVLGKKTRTTGNRQDGTYTETKVDPSRSNTETIEIKEVREKGKLTYQKKLTTVGDESYGTETKYYGDNKTITNTESLVIFDKSDTITEELELDLDRTGKIAGVDLKLDKYTETSFVNDYKKAPPSPWGGDVSRLYNRLGSKHTVKGELNGKNATVEIFDSVDVNQDTKITKVKVNGKAVYTAPEVDDTGIKFSKSKFKITRDGIIATGLGIQNGIIFDPKTKTYKLAPEVIDYIKKNTPKPRKNKTKPKAYYPPSEVLGYFKEFYDDLPTSAQLDLSLQNTAITKEMGRISRLVPEKASDGHLFEAVIARYGYNTLKSVQPGITIISKFQAAKKLKTTPSKLPDIVLWDGRDNWESADSLFTAETKFSTKNTDSRAGGVTIADYKFEDFVPSNIKVLDKYDSLDETGKVINKAWKQDMLKQFSEPLANFVKEAEALGTKIIDSKTPVPISTHNALRKVGNSFLSKVRATGKVKADQIVSYYNNGKFKPVKSDVIGDASKGVFTLGVDPHGLYANGILPKLTGDYQVTMRLKTNITVNSKGETVAKYTPILEIEFRSSDIKGEYAPTKQFPDGRKVDASDLKLQNKKDFETILKNVKGFKASKSKSTSKAMELGQLTNKDTEAVGMSTFDFDETLIIDGKNFITATKGDDVVKITSSQWPLVGDAYASEGYTFDFSDFVNVRGGVDGPLLQKMKNQISKYGVKNVFVLTARPAESATAIQGWLESKGINIPLENITGLGNSSGDAKAQWMLDKFAEGYNDMYFVDDALPNVKAVKNVLDQLDIKSNVQQAKIKFSKTASQKLNDMIERKKGIDSDEIVSSAAARRKGENINKFQIFVPPTAEDFSGLLYYFAGKGKQGDADLAFMKEFLLDPLSRGERDIAIKKQSLIRGYNELKNKNWKAAAKIKEMAGDTPYTKGTAVRVYLWNQDKTDIPGLSDKEVQELVDLVKNDPDLIAYADGLRDLVGDSEGKYITPSNDWVVETIAKDLQDATSRVGRKKFLAEFIENADAFFSKDNLNKMEAAYGKDFRESLEDMLYRIKTGQNRPSGTDASTKKWMNWLNNSVGAIMFFNTKSAVLQLMSTVNYLNWSDNNFLLAGKAFANQKQFWSDFSMLWNSDFLKQRRFGLSTDINEAEIANAAAGAKNKATAVLAYLLKKGFLPTQIADSFAISSGGAAFYRNRVNSYVKQGIDQKAAEEKAMTDFREITEENQQSSRPDRISKQQASPLGRVILAFQNTPMQYARIIKKSVADIVAGRGDLKTHVSKIIFYGGVQSLIFGAMQNALFALAFDDEEDDKKLTKTEQEKKQKKRDTQYERTLNTMLDSLLNGSGLTGRVLSTVKNVIFKFMDEQDKGWNSDMGNVAIEAANISPPLGSKLRKIKKAGDVYDWNAKVIAEMDVLDINNPVWESGANAIEATTNVPAARAIKKLESIREAFNQNNETWQRIAVAMGWSQWDLGIEGQKRQAVQETKEYLKKKKKDEKAKNKKTSSKKRNVKKSSSQDTYFNKVIKSRKNEASKVQGGEYRCTALTQDLSQCKNRTDNSSRKCFLHN